MAQHNRSRNHNRPLYQLPFEILTEVLSLALQDDISFPRIYMQQLRMFASVSHQWLLLVKGTPSFWKLASSDMPLPLLQQVLSRSAGHLLDIVYAAKRHDDIPSHLFTALVVEHAHRWRSLIVLEHSSYEEREDEAYRSLVHVSAPVLGVMTFLRSREPNAAMDLFSGEARRLRCVTLRSFYVPWESKMLSSLTTLNLEGPQGRGPSRVQLLASLAASPGLIELKLKNFEYPKRINAAPPQTISVGLPMLETLGITGISQELTHNLLATIHAPRCTSFEILYEQEPDSDISLPNDPALAHISSVLIGAFRAAPLITITWCCKDEVVLVSTSTEAIKLKFLSITQGDWCGKVPTGLSTPLEEATSSEIHLDFSRRNSPSTILPLLGSSQCRVTRIHMSQHEGRIITDLMQFLAEPTMIDGVGQWPLPRLRRLFIVDSEPHRDDLVEVISNSSRYRSAGSSMREGIDCHRPGTMRSVPPRR
ncbi:hypothetical protein FRB94_002257 [Tulasnella sp. JGI-2019a]|nr:hypothetical protein FRB94_002257 [Tulasnella sp. JGI-2019a]